MRANLSSCAVTVIALVGSGVSGLTACRATQDVSTKASTQGGLNVRLTIEPDPPVADENRLLVEVRDEGGRPVGDVQLHLAFDMSAMGSMPEMKGEGKGRPLGGGRYEVDYQLPMQGDWNLTVDMAPHGRSPQQLRLKVSTGRRGLVLESGGGEEGGALSDAGKLLDILPGRQQLIGITYGTVAERPLSVVLRAAGRIKVDERNLAEVSLRYEAYVRSLSVAETGKSVRAGQPLLRVYSPDLLAVEEELLNLERGANNPELVGAAKRRLRLWDVSAAEVVELERRGTADGTATVQAPINGVVLEKNVVEGSHLMAGTVLYRIGNLGRIWVETQLYESDAPFVAVGQQATVQLPALGTADYRGRVTFVAPTLDEKSRTLAARVELQNPDLVLKPGMFAEVDIARPLGTRLAVPDRALLLSGEHRYAFVERSQGKLQPVEVQLGALTGDWDEVRSGLSVGDRVVLNAAFLVSSEAQLRDALPRWPERRSTP
jgi:membrane fusion protein, copper/silver efflux system